MERAQSWRSRWRIILLAGIAVFAVILLRSVLLALATQIFWAYLLMAAALPLCRVLERKLSPSLAATGAFAALSLAGAGCCFCWCPRSSGNLNSWGKRCQGLCAL